MIKTLFLFRTVFFETLRNQPSSVLCIVRDSGHWESGRWRAQFTQPASFYVEAIQIGDEYEEIRQHAIVSGSPSLGSWTRSGLRGCSIVQVENEADCQNPVGINASTVQQVLSLRNSTKC